jgi:hypothetical protein
MEPSSELLQLLREIRNGQHELLALNRAWMQQAERQHQTWRQGQLEYEARIASEKEVMARWDEANVLWLRQNRPWQRSTVTVVAILLACSAVVGVLAATGWITW